MPKRILQGTVTSTANAQTVTVLIERRFTHPVLKRPCVKPRNTALMTSMGNSPLVTPFASKNVHRSRKPNAGKYSRKRSQLIETLGVLAAAGHPKGREKPNDPDADQSGCC